MSFQPANQPPRLSSILLKLIFGHARRLCDLNGIVPFGNRLFQISLLEDASITTFSPEFIKNMLPDLKSPMMAGLMNHRTNVWRFLIGTIVKNLSDTQLHVLLQ